MCVVVLAYPGVVQFEDQPSRLDGAIQVYIDSKHLQDEGDIPEPVQTLDTSTLPTSQFDQYKCVFPPGTLGMYFKGKNTNDDVLIESVQPNSTAMQNGCAEGDLLISVCGAPCRGRGLQHAIDCVLKTQVRPIPHHA